MIKRKTILMSILYLFLIIMVVILSSCSSNNDKNGPINNNDENNSPSEIIDDNNIKDIEVDSNVHEYIFVSNEGDSYTYQCSDCKETAVVTISFSSGTSNCYTVDNNTIIFSNITEESVYSISGVFYGNIVIDVSEEYKFELELNRFELFSSKDCPINIYSGNKVTISAKKETDNYIYDIRDEVSEDDYSGSIYSNCDLNIQGKGSLYVKSLNNNGIHTKDDLKIKNLTLQVDSIDNALKGNDSVSIESGTLVLIARKGDGIKTKNSDISSKGNQRGIIAITGGDILIYAACDGIDAAYDVNIDETSATVKLQVFTDKYSKYSDEVTYTTEDIYYVRFNSTSYKYSLKYYNDENDAVWYNSSSYTSVGNYKYYPIQKISTYSYVQLYIYSSSQTQGQDQEYVACTEGLIINNNYDTIGLQLRNNNLQYSWTNYTTSSAGGMRPGGPGGMNEGNLDKSDYSTKGIKADNQIMISAGSITISSYDDSIHANNDVILENALTALGNVIISGGVLNLYSNDDGIHADGKSLISNGDVNIINSYEGIEGSVVEIAGGNVSITSSDDGVNGTGTSGESIIVSGGNLYVYAGGDGLDSNSRSSYDGILFSGGYSVIISTGNSDSSIDSEQGYKYTGGYVIGIGRSGGMGNEAIHCSPSISSIGKSTTINLQSGNYLVVSNYVTVKMPVSVNAQVVFLGKTGVGISSSSTNSFNLNLNGVYWDAS